MKRPVIGPDGTRYPSHSAAARALGVHVTTITRHIEEFGHLELIGQGRTVACTWRGKTYPSIKAVAEAAGVCPQSVSTLLRLHGHLDTLGVGRGSHRNKPSKSTATKIGPFEWRSRRAAAHALGVNYSSFCMWLSPSASPRQRDQLMAAVMRHEAALRKGRAA
ncbi:NUMOD1 domain-containing DNA-binding protein [Paracoccus sp. (in: a-proteobacteria)]|uniref:NUMOD1 domain-containing DNA-binding protein n=1 Tax=Paracoccus sp. TaxID=267 RepID=UPI00272D30AF|nr:NUMOD1 domain-containing DNA-binding protein [Paracoccus sp. (in: a-proteobacteria)]